MYDQRAARLPSGKNEYGFALQSFRRRFGFSGDAVIRRVTTIRGNKGQQQFIRIIDDRSNNSGRLL